MSGVPEAIGVLTARSIEEALRFAYAASQLMPAGFVVGAAAVLAGVLGATAMRRERSVPRETPGAQLPWVLVAALCWGLAAPAGATVVCRKGDSARLVVRADACRAREHAVDAAELGLGRATTCVEDVAAAWDALRLLRGRLESARRTAELLAEAPWDGAETWLALEAAAIRLALDRFAAVAAALGVVSAAEPVARIRAALTDDWSQPVYACSEALAAVALLEAALPVPAAD